MAWNVKDTKYLLHPSNLWHAGNAREVCPGNPKEIFGKSGWEKHTEISMNLGSSGIEPWRFYYPGCQDSVGHRASCLVSTGHVRCWVTVALQNTWSCQSATCSLQSPAALCRNVLVPPSHWGLHTSKQASELVLVLTMLQATAELPLYKPWW